MLKINSFNSKKALSGLLLAFFCVFAYQAGFFQVSGVDTGFHIRTGEIVWQTGIVPSTNTFSSYCPDHPWLLHQWLPATLIYLAWAKMGIVGLVACKALLGAAIFLVVYLSCLRESNGRNGYLFAFWAVTLAIVLARIRILERPYLFSALLLALVFHADRKYYEKRAWHFLAIPLLIAFWSNVHMGVLVGCQLLLILRFAKWVQWAAYRVRKKQDNSLCGQIRAPLWQTVALLGSMALAALTVSIINPNGIKVLAAPVTFYLDPYWKSAITELAPVEGFTKLLLLGFCAAVVALQAMNRKTLDLGLILLFTFFAWLAFRTQRAILFFAIAATPLLAKLLTVHFAKWSLRTSFVHMTALPIVWASLILFSFIPDPTFTYGPGINKRYHPVDVFRFILKEVPPQAMYNDMAYGGPILWYIYPEFRPFTDGRGEAYDLDFWKNVYTPISLGHKSLEFFDQHHMSAALTWNPSGTATPLAVVLRNSPEWHLVAYDDFTMLYLKDTEANAGVISRYAISSFDPTESSFAIAKDGLIQAGMEARAALATCPSSIYWKTAVARTALLNGDYSPAEALYKELVTMKGASYPYARDHAYCLYMLGNMEDAEAAFTLLTEHPQQDGYPWYMLAVIARDRGSDQAAGIAIRKAIQVEPSKQLYLEFQKATASGD